MKKCIYLLALLLLTSCIPSKTTTNKRYERQEIRREAKCQKIYDKYACYDHIYTIDSVIYHTKVESPQELQRKIRTLKVVAISGSIISVILLLLKL